YNIGDVVDTTGRPTHFEPLDASEIDFSTAEKEELMAKKWKFSEASDAMFDLYNVELTKGPKADIVNAIIDARYRGKAGVAAIEA
ncbi:MAG: hypothetical protein DRR06_20590, partial [Gammaproteobacteria bacterium]